MSDRPSYDKFTDFASSRGSVAETMAHQILDTCRPWLPKPIGELDVLDVGAGYGGTSLVLSRFCRRVTALEPAAHLHQTAAETAAASEHGALEHRHGEIEAMHDVAAFDLVVLDNVYEHLPDHETALASINRAMRPEAVLFLLVPNKLWPVEAHYRLPFLSWLPLTWADRYLKWSGRGHSYADASYAPTYWSLRKALSRHPELEVHFVLPHNPGGTVAGQRLHYRWGMAALRRWPALWCISKALLVVAVKRSTVNLLP